MTDLVLTGEMDGVAVWDPNTGTEFIPAFGTTVITVPTEIYGLGQTPVLVQNNIGVNGTGAWTTTFTQTVGTVNTTEVVGTTDVPRGYRRYDWDYDYGWGPRWMPKQPPPEPKGQSDRRFEQVWKELSDDAQKNE